MEGIVREVCGGHEIRFERYLKHPVDKVWAAVTEPALLIGWLAEAEVEPTPGGLVQLRWLNVKEPGQEIVAKGTKTVFDPPHLVEYNTDIHGRLRFELREDGRSTTRDGSNCTTGTRSQGANPGAPPDRSERE